jgi:hypothetical protein
LRMPCTTGWLFDAGRFTHRQQIHDAAGRTPPAREVNRAAVRSAARRASAKSGSTGSFPSRSYHRGAATTGVPSSTRVIRASNVPGVEQCVDGAHFLVGVLDPSHRPVRQRAANSAPGSPHRSPSAGRPSVARWRPRQRKAPGEAAPADAADSPWTDIKQVAGKRRTSTSTTSTQKAHQIWAGGNAVNSAGGECADLPCG